MQLTNTQIKALSNVSNLDLRSNSYIRQNEITNLPLLLNAIAVSKTALNNNIKLPLSKTDTTEIYNQIIKMPYVYPSDLKCKYTRGSFYTTATLPQTDEKRHIIVIDKKKATPKKYPRKAGTPAKLPLTK